MSTQKSIEETGYTEQEESLWSSLWHDGYDADKENLIRTFRSIVQAERDRAEEEKQKVIDVVIFHRNQYSLETDREPYDFILRDIEELTNPQDN